MTGQDIINAFNASQERQYNEYGEHVSIPVFVDGVESLISITLQGQIHYLVWGAPRTGRGNLMATVHFAGGVIDGREWLESVQVRQS